MTEMVRFVEADINREKALDDLRAVQAGLPPAASVVLAPSRLPRNAAEARRHLDQAREAYEAVREQHDEEHTRLRAEWVNALTLWSMKVITEQGNKHLADVFTDQFQDTSKDLVYVDAPRCPDHPAIVLWPKTSRRPGWCCVCGRRRPLPDDNGHSLYTRLKRRTDKDEKNDRDERAC